MLHTSVFSRPFSRAHARRKRQLFRQASSPEVLESRALLSGSGGTTWADPSNLTVSFAPDGTDVVGQTSDLFAKLDALASRSEWQKTAFRAFQTWATEADVNIGVVDDGGQAFGTIGATQGDLRFGDIRLAAVPLAGDVSALSISSDVAMSGTWVGDIIINSEADFTSLDQFYAVMLHEAGHVLGLEHSDDSSSPMFASPNTDRNLQPTTADIHALRLANGSRVPDANESKRANDTIKRATRIKYSATSSGYDGQTPLLSYGDITTQEDVDYFVLPTLSNYNGPLTFSLRSEGLSLLSAKITVLDDRGQIIASRTSGGRPGGDLSVTFHHDDDDSEYIVRVEADPQAGVFAVGSFALVTTFETRNQVSGETLNEVLRLRYDFLAEEERRVLFDTGAEPAFFDDLHLDDTLATATSLKSLPHFAEFREYETTAGISDLTDTDFYSVKAPDFSDNDSRVMTISVQATRIGGLLSDVAVYDASGIAVDARVITHNAGTLTVQVSGIQSKKTYFVRISSSQSAGRFATGNYRLSVSFNQPEVVRNQLSTGELSAVDGIQGFALDINQTQLFQLALTSTIVGTEPVAVQLSIYNARGALMQRVVGLAGDTRTGQTLLLTVGTYYVRVQAIGRNNQPVPRIDWSVEGTTMTDPTGPILGDPTSEPPLPDPTLDPIDVVDWPAVIDDPLIEDPLINDPWSEIPDDPFLDPFFDPMTDSLLVWYWI
ncbi:MAG: matrixin family metalloprotease [Planctomycetaceae bacterium]